MYVGSPRQRVRRTEKGADSWWGPAPKQRKRVRVEERLEWQEIKGNEVTEVREGRAAGGVRVGRARCCQEVKQDVLKVGPPDVFTRRSPYSWEKQSQWGERRTEEWVENEVSFLRSWILKRREAKTGEGSWGHCVSEPPLSYSWGVLGFGHPGSNLSSEAFPSSPFILIGKKKTKAEKNV